MKKYLSVVMLFALVGCVPTQVPSAKSLNIQRAAIRGGADMAVTISLDMVSDASVVNVQKSVKDSAMAVNKFLNTGNVGDLTTPELIAELRKIVPVDYQFIVDILLSQISVIHVDVDKIGKNNVRRLLEVTNGMIAGCDLYKLEDRPVKTDTNVSEAKATRSLGNKEEISKFEASLRKEMNK